MATRLMACLGLALAAPGIGAAACERVENGLGAQYVQYERLGQGRPVYVGESTERLWFSLRNNTTCPILIVGSCPSLLREAPGQLPVVESLDGNEVVLIVDVLDRRNGRVRATRNAPAPTCVLPAGQHVLFSVALSDAQRALLSVRFQYAWDRATASGGAVQHTVEFDPAEVVPHELRPRVR